MPEKFAKIFHQVEEQALKQAWKYNWRKTLNFIWEQQKLGPGGGNLEASEKPAATMEAGVSAGKFVAIGEGVHCAELLDGRRL